MIGGVMYLEISVCQQLAHIIVFFQDYIPYWFWLLKILYLAVIATFVEKLWTNEFYVN
jgi:hypothetical protein